jgi:sirohydrochlorin cobaltochelatase
MKTLVVLAHGSKVEKSNQEVECLANALSTLLPEFERVETCFLELATPKFSDMLEHLAQESVGDITVYPHFLAEGRHVRDDVPSILDSFERSNPKINVTLKPYLGDWSGLAEFIAKGLR